jgi:putative Mn2+ efflux pump MntP
MSKTKRILKKVLLIPLGAIVIWVFYFTAWTLFFVWLATHGFDFTIEIPDYIYFFSTLLAFLFLIWIGVILLPDYIYEWVEKRAERRELNKQPKGKP